LPSQGLPQEYIISFCYSNLSGHGIAFSSLTGIAGGFINYNKKWFSAAGNAKALYRRVEGFYTLP
jgi:hypothetical protein